MCTSSTRAGWEAHDVLLCIADGTQVAQGERRRVTPEHRFKTAAEMAELFADLPEALVNTLVIAQRCAFRVPSQAPILPVFPTTAGQSEIDELRARAQAGLETRLSTQIHQDGMDLAARAEAARPYRERLDYELGVIEGMNYAGYFLIVADFIQWAKAQGVPVGPGRGSGAGSVVAWALSITDLDPLRFGLLFERFLNPERVSMPDFDIDFCQDRRDDVIRYVRDKYGSRAGRGDHHLRQAAGARGAARCRPRTRHALRPGRPGRQAGAVQSGQPADPGAGAGAGAPARRGGARGRAGGAPDRDRAAARGSAAPRLDPCRGRGDRRPPAR